EGKITRFAYDAGGNRLSLTTPGTFIAYAYDPADRLLSAGSAGFTYDANGSQTSKTSSGKTRTFTYDAANRLRRVTDGTTVSSFAYDGDGNRVTPSVR